MTGTLRSLLALGEAPRSRVALTVALGSATIVFGVGLMGTAGYLISRAAERPAILSLTAAIVGVRFFGIARPIAPTNGPIVMNQRGPKRIEYRPA